MQHKFLYARLVNFLVPLAGVSTDIYLPSLPAMGMHFAVSKGVVQLTVVIFTLGVGIGQLIAGPVSDALGRKKLLVVALFMQLLAVIAILYAPFIQWVIASRFLQGFSAAFVSVPARAILGDVFEGDEFKKQFNYASISFALGPILAPFVGGYMQHYFGWQANFMVVLLYILLALVFVIGFYRETGQHMHAFSVPLLWRNYMAIVHNQKFVLSFVLAGLLIAPTMVFNVAAPYIIQVSMQQTAVVFGQMALLVGLAWFLGNVTNRALFHVCAALKFYVGLSIALMVSLGLLGTSLAGFFSLWLLMVPIFTVIYVCGGLFSLTVAEGLAMVQRSLMGSANAIFFSAVWCFVTLFAWIATLVKSHSLVPISGVTLVILLLALGLSKYGSTID
jgi:DHA1 family bicyclomycin/chloramphenicol resistance-like MFS transporter